MGQFDGKVAVITGGGRGIGHGVALALAAEGASVAIDDVYFAGPDGETAAKTVTEELATAGGREGNSLLLAEDVRSADGAQSMVDQTVDRFGQLDILVNCAGNNVRGLIQDLTKDEWESVIGLHLTGHFLACQAAVKHMLTRDYGRIVTISSRGSIYGVPNSKLEARSSRKPASTAYASAKAGILGLSTVLALELWETGITVNCVLPSATTQLFPETKPRAVAGLPLTTSMDPDYVAPFVAFLCSDAAKNVSGRIAYASGGDVLFFGPLLNTSGGRMIRKNGKWEIDELAEIIPALVEAEPA